MPEASSFCARFFSFVLDSRKAQCAFHGGAQVVVEKKEEAGSSSRQFEFEEPVGPAKPLASKQCVRVFVFRDRKRRPHIARRYSALARHSRFKREHRPRQLPFVARAGEADSALRGGFQRKNFCCCRFYARRMPRVFANKPRGFGARGNEVEFFFQARTILSF